MTVTIRCRANGPFVVEGPITVVDHEGNPFRSIRPSRRSRSAAADIRRTSPFAMARTTRPDSRPARPLPRPEWAVKSSPIVISERSPSPDCGKAVRHVSIAQRAPAWSIAGACFRIALLGFHTVCLVARAVAPAARGEDAPHVRHVAAI